MFNILIFTKDRPAQLDLALRSIQENLAAKVFVTASWSSDEFRTGYEILKKEYPNIVFWDRQNLMQDIYRFLCIKSNLIAWATDDSYVYRRPEYTELELNSLFNMGGFQSFSHRLGLNCTNQDPFNSEVKMARPNFINNGKFLMWNRSSVNEWNNYQYPFSVDLNIYRRQDILEQVAGLNCETPNFFEAEMCKRQIKTFNACLHESSVVTIPANRVQSEFKNGHAGVDPVELNRRFLNGERLSVKPEQIIGSHQVLEFEWK